MIRLFTTWYDDRKPERQAEYLQCLAANLECDAISQVCLVVEGSASVPESPKLHTTRVSGRPTYNDFIAWINELAGPDDVSIIANTDVHFDESIAVIPMVMPRDQAYALARWEGTELSYRNDSQDAWVFHGPVRWVAGDFFVGVPRCDNRFIHELRTAGYHVRNPSFSIKAHHIHGGEARHYSVGNEDTWVEPPYGYVWPHNLLPLRQTLWHNARHPGNRIGWRIDPRAFVLTLPGRISRRIRRGFRSELPAS